MPFSHSTLFSGSFQNIWPLHFSVLSAAWFLTEYKRLTSPPNSHPTLQNLVNTMVRPQSQSNLLQPGQSGSAQLTFQFSEARGLPGVQDQPSLDRVVQPTPCEPGLQNQTLSQHKQAKLMASSSSLSFLLCSNRYNNYLINQGEPVAGCLTVRPNLHLCG